MEREKKEKESDRGNEKTSHIGRKRSWGGGKERKGKGEKRMAGRMRERGRQVASQWWTRDTQNTHLHIPQIVPIVKRIAKAAPLTNPRPQP